MSLLRHVDPEPYAAAYVALEWPTEAIATVLADTDGHALSFEHAYDLAWSCGQAPVTHEQRRGAEALLAMVGLPLTPAGIPKYPEDQLLGPQRGPSECPVSNLLSAAIYLARELADAGSREAQIAHALVDEYEMPPRVAAEAAAIAITDPHSDHAANR